MDSSASKTQIQKNEWDVGSESFQECQVSVSCVSFPSLSLQNGTPQTFTSV